MIDTLIDILFIDAYLYFISKTEGETEATQHHLKRRPDHRKVASSQTSELVCKAPKTCNSYPDAIFKWHH